MTSYTSLEFTDFLTFNNVNFDRLTETYGINFYSDYLMKWPELQVAARHGPTGVLMGYMIGKAEGAGENWHGHVSAVTVAPAFRRMGLGRQLMEGLEKACDQIHQAYFVDLFVRKGNTIAQQMYKNMGYIAYRTVLGYYQDGLPGSIQREDALDLRKPLSKNATRSTSAVIPLEKPITPDDLEWN